MNRRPPSGSLAPLTDSGSSRPSLTFEGTSVTQTPNSGKPTGTLPAMLLPELRSIANQLGIKGARQMRKADLITAIREAGWPGTAAHRAMEPAGLPALRGNPRTGCPLVTTRLRTLLSLSPQRADAPPPSVPVRTMSMARMPPSIAVLDAVPLVAHVGSPPRAISVTPTSSSAPRPANPSEPCSTRRVAIMTRNAAGTGRAVTHEAPDGVRADRRTPAVGPATIRAIITVPGKPMVRMPM